MKKIISLLITTAFFIGCVSVNTKMNSELNEVYSGMSLSDFKSKVRNTTLVQMEDNFSCYKLEKQSAKFGQPGGYVYETRFFYFKDNKLTSRWVFDSKNGDNPYSGMGYHNLSVADVDNDGKDEIIFGSMCIDDNGKGLYTTGFRHGDALHVSDLDPELPGLEVLLFLLLLWHRFPSR